MFGYNYRKSAKVRVKNVHFLNVRVKKYSRSQDSYVLQCILLKTFVRLMFAVLAIRELFLTVNFCRFTVYTSLVTGNYIPAVTLMWWFTIVMIVIIVKMSSLVPVTIA